MKIHAQETMNYGLVGLVLSLDNLYDHCLGCRAFSVTKEITIT